MRSVDEILPWLQEALAHFYRPRTYAACLNPEVREFAPRNGYFRHREPAQCAARIAAPNATMIDGRSGTVRRKAPT